MPRGSFDLLPRSVKQKIVYEQRFKDIKLVLECLKYQENISHILRTAEVFGISEVIIIPHKSGEAVKIFSRITKSAEKWLKISVIDNWEDARDYLRAEGFVIAVCLVDPNVKSLWDCQLTGKVAVVVGNEVAGVSKKAKQDADVGLYIPQFGFTESLNVSSATAVVLYELIRQRKKKS